MTAAPSGPGRLPGGPCAEVRTQAREALILRPREALPEQVRSHAEECLGCRGEIEELSRVEEALAGTFREVHRAIPPPSVERVESILAGARGGPALPTLGRIRRTVKRMLLLTILLLSLLPLALIAWLLLQLLGGRNGP
jgi:hypothetical protein